MADLSVAPLDVVRAHPLCAETPAPLLAAALTPAASVYVRSNFETPPLDASHVLSFGGAVATPFRISMPELAALPHHTVTVTMECAGNGRLGMDPVPTGEPWRFGAVSTTTWRGVPLRALLARAGVLADGVEVLARAADRGPRDDADGLVRFERSLPLPVALAPDTLIATHMDGAPLTTNHGAPVRLVVPGWYGMASVKWLASLEVITTPFTGYFQRQRYVYLTPEGIAPVREALVKSMIVEPLDGTSCPRDLTVRGWAWSGAAAITSVELSVNDGAWQLASLGTALSRWAWTPFSAVLALPPGAVSLRSRATDASGAVQPERIVWNALGYGNNAIRAITVTATSEGGTSEGAPPAFVIRRAVAADAAALSAFARRIFAATFGADNTPDDLALYLAESFLEAQQHAEIVAADRRCLLLEVEGVLAAYALLHVGEPQALVPSTHPVELQRFYVDEPWHGRGIAPAFMSAVCAAAQEAGGDVLWLGVWERNPRAIRFYEKQGFRDVGAQVFVLGTDTQTDRVMARRL